MRQSIICTCHRSETPPTTAPALIHSLSRHFCIFSKSSLMSLLHSNATNRPLTLPITSGVPRSEKTLPWILIAFELGSELRYLRMGTTAELYSRGLSRLLTDSLPYFLKKPLGLHDGKPRQSPLKVAQLPGRDIKVLNQCSTDFIRVA